MTDQQAQVLASDMMTATSLVSKINNQRNRIAGGYDIPTDEPGPINIVAQALADERRRVWEEAAKMACSRCAVGMPRNEHWFHLTCDATKYWLKAHAGQEG